MRGVEEGGPGGGWEMQPLSGLHRASDGYLGTVSRGQSGRGSAATAPAVVKPEPQAHGAQGPLLAMGVILCLAVHISPTWLHTHQQWQQ